MSLPDIQIRQAGESDAEVVTKIYVDSWNAGFGSRMPIIQADTARITFYTSTGWRLSKATRNEGNQVRYSHDL